MFKANLLLAISLMVFVQGISCGKANVKIGNFENPNLIKLFLIFFWLIK